MSILTSIFGGSVGEVIGKVGEVIDSLHTSGEEKEELKIKLQEILQQRDADIENTLRTELGAKERILVAELQQGDNYTKRARPSVVYVGLIFIFINYILVPIISKWNGLDVTPLELPEYFWIAWGGIVATWSVGRSMEKSGVGGKIVSKLTGNKRNVRPSLGL